MKPVVNRENKFHLRLSCFTGFGCLNRIQSICNWQSQQKEIRHFWCRESKTTVDSFELIIQINTVLVTWFWWLKYQMWKQKVSAVFCKLQQFAFLYCISFPLNLCIVTCALLLDYREKPLPNLISLLRQILWFFLYLILLHLILFNW